MSISTPGPAPAVLAKRERVAIVAGLRTPFVKSGTVFRNLSALDLAKACVAELLARADVDPGIVDQVVYGQVVPFVQAPNIAREVVLGTALPKSVEAYSVARACATGTQALVNAAQAILSGSASVIVCGGADSLSRPPITYSDAVVVALMEANATKEPLKKARAFLRLRPGDLLPTPPALREYSTGLTMGESAEVMAKENHIAREAQDAFALRSHKRSAAAWEKGIYKTEVMPVRLPPSYAEVIQKDGLVRADSTFEKLAALPPVFDRKYGTITAGSSSPLTDGAAALLVMSESRAKALGMEPLAFVRAWAFAAVDPGWQLLQAPPFAAARALDRAKLTLGEIDVVDMHEAFAAQVLSNLQAFGSKEFAKKHLGRDEPLGEVPDEKLNLHGGSISLGHPFAATGARQALTVANELRRRGSGTALITQCAAGGMGAALVLER